MRILVVPRALRVLACAASAAILVLLASAQASAQRREPGLSPYGRPVPPGVNPAPPPPPPSVRAPSVREREYVIRGMEAEAKRPPTEEQQRLAMQQIAEDYRTIQQVNNRMMAAAMKKGAALDYAQISNVTSEIKRRALRLRDNITLPKPDKLDKKVTAQRADDEEQLKKSLLLLDNYLMSFVGSALFKNPGVYDAKAAARAGEDLASVIELSQTVNAAAAQKLNEPAKAKQ